MSIFFEAYRKVWDWYADPKFKKNAEWQQIESEKVVTETTISYDHPRTGLRLFDQLDIEHEVCPRTWKNPMAWGWMLHWWLKEHGIRATRRDLKWFWQRGKKGYSDYDLYSFDSYLSKVISNGVIELRDTLHGWPGEPMTFTEWEQILTDISDGFKAGERLKWDHDMTPEETVNAEIASNRGWSLFREHYGHLWD